MSKKPGQLACHFASAIASAIAIAFTLATLGCQATSSTVPALANPDGSNGNASNKIPTRIPAAKSTTLPQSSGGITNEPTEAAAQAAFLNTLAAGNHDWSMSHIVVKFSKRDQVAKDLMSWTANCSSSQPTSVVGTYPKVVVSVGRIDCGEEKNQPELLEMQLLESQLLYSAHYIPAFPLEPNQFRLDLTRAPQIAQAWQFPRALNALTKDRLAFFDFFGEHNGDLGWQDSSSRYLAISIAPDADTKALKLTVNFELNSQLPAGTTEILLSADLQ